MVNHLFEAFPKLIANRSEVTSPASEKYNCIAWAAGDTQRWWWPEASEDIFWPTQIPSEVTIESFAEAFSTLGYVQCADADFVDGIEKVAFFAKHANPTHAARQLPNGKWTSKLGVSEDIEHELRDLEGEAYGVVVSLMMRPTP